MRRYLLFLLLFAQAAKAQKIVSAGREFNFDVYTVEDGLLQSNISDLMQDSRGYIWSATQSGASRFDGMSFRNYTQKDGLTDKSVQALYEDKKGNIWLGTGRGINVLSRDSIRSYSGSEMPKEKVWCFYEDTDGSLWVGCTGKVYHLDPTNLENPFLKVYGGDYFKQYGCGRCIKRTTGGKLLIGVDAGSFIIRNDSLVREHGMSVHCISEDKNGMLYYSGWGSTVYQVKDGKIISTFDLGTYVVYSLLDSKGNVWFATFGNGIFKYDGKNLVHFGTKEGLPTNSIWTMIEDREGNLWLGSWGAGLYKFQGVRFSYLSERSGLVNNYVNTISSDKQNNIWFCTEQGVSRYNPNEPAIEKSITSYTRCGDKDVSKIMCMLIDKEQNVWLPGYGSNGYLLKSDGKMISLPWLGAFYIIQDSQGNIWRGTDGIGAIRDDGKTQKRYSLHRPGVNRIIFIYEDSRKNIWLLNEARGIGIAAADSFVVIDRQRGFRDGRAMSMTEDAQGNLWIGTNGGGIFKCRYNSNYTITILDSVTVADGLSSNDINNLVFDRKGDLVVATFNGVSVLNGAAYKKGVKSIRTFHKAEGFAGGECQPGLLLDATGKVWISSTKGAWCYDPEEDRTNPVEPNTRLTGLDLFFEHADWSDYSKGSDGDGIPLDLSLPYNKNHLTFHFIGISLTAPSKVQYRYMIRGLDKEWSPASGKREVTYSSIPPGTYTFLVKACNNDGVWNKEACSYTFTILPPFWQRGWFLVLCALSLSAMAYFFVRMRERNLVLEKKLLEEKVESRTAELKSAYKQIGEKNKDITDSINYAQRIQQTIFPSEEVLRETFKKYFVLYKPKDIVSGDFYGIDKLDGRTYFVVADCTGHGVPGAFVSLVAHNNLNKCVGELGLREPNEILDKLSMLLEESFSRNQSSLNDGMDIALCYWDRSKNLLKFAGANNPIWIIRDGNLMELKGDSQPVGRHWVHNPFTAHIFHLKKGDRIYLFSDGFADQFGGPKGKKFKYRQLQEKLLQTSGLDMAGQKQALENILAEWMGKLEQVDDIVIMGIEIDQ